MRHSLELDGQQLAYTLKRSARRRSVGLRIAGDGLTITLPARAPLAEAERVIRLKADWIMRHLQAPKPPAARLAAGSTILWQGQPRTLQAGASRARLAADTLALAAPDEPEALTLALARFCQRAARPYFLQRVEVWQQRMNLHPRRVLLSSARTRWGSCTAAGDVRLSWRLMQAPPEVIDYVIIHELAHLAEMNHSPRFWAIVAAACPNWKQQREWLKQHAQALLA
ncbi:hypothetical protein SAMN02745857_02603 [Andreprevotia lacus DSM 23236]|jgi:predicted metal-dependent hydrolase|uniref:YgjP-like metallopeptidase domain-containing protein n=1 Tax=Andreprevotia lacus DSM 23236 TaxID=1121001 RepID=A0A1W1XTG6_9NEIS|nr:SprT family zinc-dependent metalloprotease [Andreprevotia lacus]SMC26818.1 hypothetical protein SAMN02745857_02603 [Andreprevotia lacus DSM 23236]